MSDTPQAPDWFKASDGKWYPPAAPGRPPPPGHGFTPPPQPAKSKGGCLKVGLIVLGILVVLAIGGAALSGGGDDEESDTAADEGQGQEEGGGERQERFAIGETAETGDLSVTVHAVENPMTPGEFEVPPEGQHFVAVELTIVNNGDEPAPMSTILGTELTDSAGRAWNIALAGLDRPRIDGEIEVGGQRRGFVTFAAAADATGLELRVRGSLTANGAVFTLG